MTASEATIDRALDVAGKLYIQLEAAGTRVVIPSGNRQWHGMTIDEREVPKNDRDRYYYYQSRLWSPMRPTVAFFQETAIAIAVIEMSEEVLLRYVDGGYIREAEYQASAKRYRLQHTWMTTEELPGGRLRIVASSAEGVEWSKSWQETDKTTIDTSLPRIAKEMRGAVPEVVALVAEARCQAEIRHQQWLVAEDRRKREEDRRRIEQSIKQSREDLAADVVVARR